MAAGGQSPAQGAALRHSGGLSQCWNCKQGSVTHPRGLLPIKQFITHLDGTWFLWLPNTDEPLMPDKRFLLKTPAEKLIIWEKSELLTRDKASLVLAGGEAVPGKP